MSNKLSGGATYEPVDGQTYKGQQVYIFASPCEFMCDRHEVSLQGVKFTLCDPISYGTVDAIKVLPESYDLLKPRIGDWHWRYWVFDGSSEIEITGEEIEPVNR